MKKTSQEMGKKVATIIGLSLVPIGVLFSYFFNSQFRNWLLMLLIAWFGVAGFWALFTGKLFYPGGGKAPMTLVEGKISRFIGLIMLITALYCAYIIISSL